MTSAEKYEFRITAWPNVSLPVPLYYKAAPGRGTALPFVYVGGAEEVDLPEELYLREIMDLDLKSDEALLEFMEAWGIPNVDTFQERIVGGWDDVFPRTGDPRRYDPTRSGAAILTEIERAVTDHLGPDESWEEREFIHVGEARIRLALIRDMVRIVAATQGLITGSEVSIAWESAWLVPDNLIRADALPEGYEDWSVIRNGLTYRGRNQDVLWAWEDVMVPFANHALVPFHARIEIPAGLERPESNWGYPAANLYQSLCLQLVDGLIEGTPMRRCANDRCGHLFIKQRGRSKYGQQRTRGVDYCSIQCNRAVSQRRSRANRQAAAALAGVGKSRSQIAKEMDVSTETVSRWLK